MKIGILSSGGDCPGINATIRGVGKTAIMHYGMEVIDSGVAVLSMHAPWEVTSKADVYEAYRGYKSFLRNI